MLGIVTNIVRAPRIVKVLLVQQFFEGFVPIMALYAIMFERVGNLSFEQIGLLFAIWSVAYLIVELPSGALADYWSRKNVIFVGGLLRAIGMAVWLLYPGFVGYAIGFALWGAMIACTSGAVAAYLHSELEADRRVSKYAKYFGWIMAAHWLGTLIGYGVASVLTLAFADELILLSLASSLLFATVLAIMPEREYERHDSYFKTLRQSFVDIGRLPILRYMCYGLFACYMIIGVVEELLPRVWDQFGVSERMIALLLAVSLGLTVLVLVKLETFVRYTITLQVLTMAAATGVLVLGLSTGGTAGTLLVLAFMLVFQLFRSVFQHHVQAEAPGKTRATVGSIPGLLSGVFGALAYVGMGVLSRYSSELFAIGLYAAGWIGLLIVLALMAPKAGRSSV